MKNTIKKRIVALSLIGAFCIPTAVYASDGLHGGVRKYDGLRTVHYTWAEHEHYTVTAKIKSGYNHKERSGWGHATTDNLVSQAGYYYYGDSSRSSSWIGFND